MAVRIHKDQAAEIKYALTSMMDSLEDFDSVPIKDVKILRYKDMDTFEIIVAVQFEGKPSEYSGIPVRDAKQYLEDSLPNDYKVKVKGIKEKGSEGLLIKILPPIMRQTISLRHMEDIALWSPRRNNPSKSKSVLGALILGGIIGHSMKKK